MNKKQRKAAIIAAVAIGMDAYCYTTDGADDGQLHVTSTTPYNCYLNNCRHSWTDIEYMVNTGRMKFFHAGILVYPSHA